MRSKLDDRSISTALENLPGWQRKGDTLERVVALKSFRQGARLVARLVDLAEGANHHPDLILKYGSVTIVLSTHDAGGITQRDVNLARVIDDVLRDENG